LVVASPAPRNPTAEQIQLIRDLVALPISDGAASAGRGYRAVFDESLLGILMIDLNGTVAECNAAAREILGKKCKELCGHPFLEATRGVATGMDWEPFDEVIAGEWDHYQVEKSYDRAGRPSTFARLTVSLVRDESGKPERAVCMVEDITQAKRAERQLKAAKEKAEAG